MLFAARSASSHSISSLLAGLGFASFLALPAACSSAPVADSGESLASAIATTDVLFNLPACLPSCTAADQARLAAESAIEAAYVAAIDSATTSVAFSMFTFSRKPIYEALVRAASRGVVVRGIMDRGTFQTTAAYCTPAACALPAPFDGADYAAMDIPARVAFAASNPLFSGGSVTDKLVILLSAPITASPHSPVASGAPHVSGVRPAPGADRLVHNKLVLIDGERLLSGSGNWSSTAVSVNLENVMRFDAADSPAVVRAYHCALDVLFTGDANRISAGLAACQRGAPVYFAPSTRADTSVVPRIVEAIDASATSIGISMHHLTHEEVFAALERARGRGVQVRLAVDDDDCNASEAPGMARIRAAGAEIRYVPTSCAIFQLSHSKYGVFDESLAINGSGNWSKAGLRRNYESFVVLDGAPAAAPFVENFAQVWGAAVPREACACDTTEASCRERYCLGRVMP